MKPITLPINVKVTYSSGAYNTGAVLGQRASSTSDAATAAGRLVDKLTTRLQLRPGALMAKALPAKGMRAGQSLWCIDVAQSATSEQS